jgi:hypothetical protein
VLVVISDFLDDDLPALFATLRRYRHRHFEILCLHLIHPDEERLPDGRAFRFIGLEGEPEIVSSPAEIVQAYRARFAQFLDTVKSLSLAAHCDYRKFSTVISPFLALEDLLVERGA